MINNNELRIGNLVLAPKALAENSYKIEGASELVPYKIIEISSSTKNELFQGIPLTREIFNNCKKFKYFKKYEYWQYNIDDAEIFFENTENGILPDGYDFGQSISKKAHPKYVHELQNLIFSLTREELQINL